jgi:hypothetical protein
VAFGNLAPMTTKLSIQDALSEVSEINYEGNQTLRLQRLGAVAIKDLMAQFAKAGTVDDYKLIALALTRLHDLQVRDYAMGLTNIENIDQSFNFWHWLLQIAPTGFIAHLIKRSQIKAITRWQSYCDGFTALPGHHKVLLPCGLSFTQRFVPLSLVKQRGLI